MFAQLAAEYKQLKAQKALLEGDAGGAGAELEAGAAAAAKGNATLAKYGQAAQKHGLPVSLLQDPTSVTAMSGSCGVLEAEIQAIAAQMTALMGQADPRTGMPRTLPPTTMARMKACQEAKQALEGKVENGQLTVGAYVESLVTIPPMIS